MTKIDLSELPDQPKNLELIKKFEQVDLKQLPDQIPRPSALEMTGQKFQQQVSGLAGKIRQFQQKSPVQAFLSGFTLLPKVAEGLAAGVAKRGFQVGKSAAMTAIAAPSVAKQLAGKEITEQEQERIRIAGQETKKAITGVGEFIPTPGAQFASGLAGESEKALSEGVPKTEALGRGLLVGAERAAVIGALRKIFGVKNQKQKLQEQTNLQQRLQPKLTAKEQRRAFAEGRVQETKPSLLFGKKPDIVKPDMPTQKAITVVKKEIPNATKLSNSELRGAIKGKISVKSNQLKPQMQKVEVSRETIRTAQEQWKNLKNQQMQDPDFSTMPGFAGTQKKFEEFVKSATKSVRGGDGKFRTKNLDDVWDIAKSYDNSIKDNIKNANSLSPSDLQFKRDMWLENRAVLRDMLTDTSKGLGKTAQTAFSTMHDLYTGMNNLISSAKVDIKGTPGLLTPKNIGLSILGAIGLKKAKDLLNLLGPNQ